MDIYAIGDLHLSSCVNKPMDVFGEHWVNHWDRIRADWQERVRDSDCVLIPGDISWAMTLEQAKPDIEEIGQMPGRKILLKGNHDYWWSSLKKVRSILPENMDVLQNNSYQIEGTTICGTRGWLCPNGSMADQDRKIYEREVQRLKLSLESSEQNGNDIIVMMHFPPFNEKREISGFVELFLAYGVKRVLYGHLHGDSLKNAFEGIWQGIEYHQVSSDHLDFKLKLISRKKTDDIF